MYKLILAGGVVLLISACATTPKMAPAAQATQQPGMQVATGTPESGDQMVCTMSYPMGSHIPQRICMTKAQMAARQKADQKAMRNMEQQNQQGTCAPSCEP